MEGGEERTVDFAFPFIRGIRAEGMASSGGDDDGWGCTVVNCFSSFEREDKSPTDIQLPSAKIPYMYKRSSVHIKKGSEKKKLTLS